jgi:ribosomal protein S12 methylthiotransferase
MDILIDKPFDVDKNVWIGRSYADAPDVDSSVFVTGQAGAVINEGDIIPVEIVAFRDYDLVGAAVS